MGCRLKYGIVFKIFKKIQFVQFLKIKPDKFS